MTTAELLAAYNLPSAWKQIRLRWLSKRYAGGTPDTKNPDYWVGGTVPWLNSGAVNQGTITVPSDFITELAVKESSAKWIPTGALVMALAGQGKTKATVGYLEIPTTGNQSLAAIVPEQIEGKYLYWWLASQYRTLRNLSSQDGRDGLNLEMIGSIICPVPPLETQRSIARFLDEQTARIDGLIEKKRALVDQLAEKRQALITRAVTKGLNPATPLRPSGIDWLGDIPAHWEVLPVKRLLEDAVGLQMGPFGGMLTNLPDYETGYKL
ncbi:restriction endonuclease subunit S [Mesorhizobium sp. M0977]|uniref:restriction endonuclease subunit S n=1 Tax=Mesorhizobium sp. M0977 TaxID=2957039 RepID=UPI003335BF61